MQTRAVSFHYRPLAKTSKVNPLILVVVALLPPLLALLYVSYTAYSQWSRDMEQTKAAILQQEKQQAKPQMLSVTVKNYPVIQKLVPLSEYTVVLNQDNETQNLTSTNTFITETAAAAITSEQAQGNHSGGIEPDQDLKLDSLDLSELSPELAERVKSALEDDTNTSKGEDNRLSSGRNESSEAYHLTEHQGRFSGQLPPMNLQTHIYASSSEHRRVKINGQELSEGDWLGEQIQLLEIAPRSITVNFNGTKIIIPDLYEWQG